MPKKKKKIKYHKHSMDNEHWIRSNWRPIAALLYLAICLFDFILAPILLAVYSMYTHTDLHSWTPLTTSGAGILHVSFGAILGIYAHSRGQEVLQYNQMNSMYNQSSMASSIQSVTSNTLPINNVSVKKQPSSRVATSVTVTDEYETTNYGRNK